MCHFHLIDPQTSSHCVMSTILTVFINCKKGKRKQIFISFCCILFERVLILRQGFFSSIGLSSCPSVYTFYLAANQNLIWSRNILPLLLSHRSSHMALVSNHKIVTFATFLTLHKVFSLYHCLHIISDIVYFITYI